MTQMFPILSSSPPPMPGQVLKQVLYDMHLKQAHVARAIGISRPRLNMILKGRCRISAEIALRLERVVGVSTRFWLKVREDYEIFEARRRISGELQSLPTLHLRTNDGDEWPIRRLPVAA